MKKSIIITLPSIALGQSWLPKLGGICAFMGGMSEVMPSDLPGAAIIKPWGLFLGLQGAAIVGFSSRQVNKTSEQMGVMPIYNPAAVPAPNPPPPPTPPQA